MAMPSAKNPRRHIPLGVKLDACLDMLGLLGKNFEWEHTIALGLRERDPITGDTIPPANDPRYIRPMLREDHRTKTFGTKATTAGSDIHSIARVKRLSKKQEEFRQRLLEKLPKEDRPPSKWPKRGFQKRPKG